MFQYADSDVTVTFKIIIWDMLRYCDPMVEKPVLTPNCVMFFRLLQED